MSRAVQVQTRLKVADNTGAKEVMCIRILGNSWVRGAGIGSVIVASVKKAAPNGSIKKGEVVKCLIVRTRGQHRRKDGSHIKFSDNAVVILRDDEKSPRGTRIFGPIAREIKEIDGGERYPKIVSSAEEVV